MSTPAPGQAPKRPRPPDRYHPPQVPVYGLDPALWPGPRAVQAVCGDQSEPALGLQTWWTDAEGGRAHLSSEARSPGVAAEAPPYWPDTETWATHWLVGSMGLFPTMTRDGALFIDPRQVTLPGDDDLASGAAAIRDDWRDATWSVDGHERPCRWWSDGRYVGAHGTVGNVTVLVAATGADLDRLRLISLAAPSIFPVDILRAQPIAELCAARAAFPLISEEMAYREATSRRGLGTVRGVDPRDTTWEVDDPAYRVYFFGPYGASEEFEVTGCDVPPVIAWAERRRGERSYVVYALVPDADPGPGLVRLAGSDPNRPG